MNLPQFTAEASLYREGSRYGWIQRPDRKAGGAGVLPQFVQCFYNRDGNPACYDIRCDPYTGSCSRKLLPYVEPFE